MTTRGNSWRVAALAVVMVGAVVAVAPGRTAEASVSGQSPCAAMKYVLSANGTPVSSVNAKQPVLLIHGLNGSPSGTWNGTGGVADVLQSDGGYFVGRFDYQSANHDWVTDPRISGTGSPAGELADAIHCMASQSQAAGGPGKVILVGYSLGGLAAQQAVSESVDGQPVAADVGGLVSIGTPWQGVDQGHLSLLSTLLAGYCGTLSGLIPATGDACMLLTSVGLGSSAVQHILASPGGGLTLPKIGGKFPVFAIAGDVTLILSEFHMRSVDAGSDGVVDVASATSPPLASGSSHRLTTATVGCKTFGLQFPDHPLANLWRFLPECFHVNLPTDPAVAQQVSHTVSRWSAQLKQAAAPTSLSLTSLVGTWQNTNPSTRGAVRFVLSQGANGLEVHGYGACSPTPCDWGVVPGQAFAADVQSSQAVSFTAKYNFGFSTDLVAGYLSGSVLTVGQWTTFTDNSGRSNYFDLETFTNGTGTPTKQGVQITRVTTYQKGVLVYFRIHYYDADNDAEGFGFVGVNGSGWAEETHPFSSPSYGIVGPNRIDYPFNLGCGTSQQVSQSDVKAWIYDTAGLRSKPVVIQLSCKGNAG